MKVEMRINGHFHLELIPEDAAEELILNEMTSRSAKGKQVTLTRLGDKGADVSVEK